jgi:hypothetical protein
MANIEGLDSQCIAPCLHVLLQVKQRLENGCASMFSGIRMHTNAIIIFATVAALVFSIIPTSNENQVWAHSHAHVPLVAGGT